MVTACLSSTSTAISWPRVSRLFLPKVSRCGIWSRVCAVGIKRMAPLDWLLGVSAIHAVTTSGLSSPQYVES